jgi:hypothetical protein
MQRPPSRRRHSSPPTTTLPDHTPQQTSAGPASTAARTGPCRHCTGHTRLPSLATAATGLAAHRRGGAPGASAHTSFPSFIAGRTGRLHLHLPSILCPSGAAQTEQLNPRQATVRAEQARTAVARAPLHQEDENDARKPPRPPERTGGRNGRGPLGPDRAQIEPVPPPQLLGDSPRSTSPGSASTTSALRSAATSPPPPPCGASAAPPPRDPPGASPARRRRHRGPATSPSFFDDRA